MTIEPDQHMIASALATAALSPCRSKRGVVLYDMATGAFRGAGRNGPPRGAPCPGRAICAGTCGQRSAEPGGVIAELRSYPSGSHAHCRAAFLFTDGLVVLPNECAAPARGEDLEL